MNPQADQLASLAGAYRFFSRLWIREVDAQLLEHMLANPFRDVLVAAGAALPRDATSATLEALEIDYCQLFLGPASHLPPYQSVWQRGRFQGESAESMGHYVSAAGCETDGLMVDHLGIQLNVMARLLQFGSESAQHLDDVCALAATYFAEHLNWTDRLLEQAIHRAVTDFYRSTIRMTAEFLHSEAPFWTATQSPLATSMPSATKMTGDTQDVRSETLCGAPPSPIESVEQPNSRIAQRIERIR